MPRYLAELYLSRKGSGSLQEVAVKARPAADAMTREGTPIRYLRAIFLGDEEVCFHLYEADSPELVRRQAVERRSPSSGLPRRWTSTWTTRQIRKEGANRANNDHKSSRRGACLTLGVTTGATACGEGTRLSGSRRHAAREHVTTTAATAPSRRGTPVDGAPTAVAAGEDAVWVVLDQGDRVARTRSTVGGDCRRADPGRERSRRRSGRGGRRLGREQVRQHGHPHRLEHERGRGQADRGRSSPDGNRSRRGLSVDLQHAGRHSHPNRCETGKVRSTSPRVVGRSAGNADYAGLAVGDGSVWVASPSEGSVVRVDARHYPPGGQADRGGSRSHRRRVADGAVWVTNLDDGTVSRIDTGSGEVVGEPIVLGGQPVGVATGEGRGLGRRPVGRGHRDRHRSERASAESRSHSTGGP